MTIENWMGCCYDFSPLIIKNSFSKKNVSLKHLGTLLSKNIVEQFHYLFLFFLIIFLTVPAGSEWEIAMGLSQL